MKVIMETLQVEKHMTEKTTWHVESCTHVKDPVIELRL